MKMRACLSIIAIFAWALAGARSACAGEGEALSFALSQSFYHDTNLYRLGDGVEPSSGGRSDTVSSTALGLQFARVYGRQGLRASVDVNHNAYANHARLDYTGTSADTGWNWVLGDRWSGRLGFSRSEQLSGFDDYTGQEQSINVHRRADAFANYWFHPSWAAGAGYARIRSRYSNGTRPGAEYDANTVDLRMTYRPRSGNRITLKVANTDGLYPRRAASRFSDREYNQQDLRFEADWQISGASRLSGYLGQTRRAYDFASNRDFSGLTGRIAADWAISGKTFLNAVFRREMGAQEDLVDNYVVTEALAISPSWQLTGKARVGAAIEWRRRDYGGDPGLIPGSLGDRSDITRRYGLSLNYQPMRSLSLYFSLQHQLRSPSSTGSGYAADSASVSARFEF